MRPNTRPAFTLERADTITVAAGMVAVNAATSDELVIAFERYDEAPIGAALARAALGAVARAHIAAGVTDEPSTRDDARTELRAVIGYATELVRQLDDADRSELDPAPRDAGDVAAELAVLADDDRDALSATVERLYDGIDAALARIDEMDDTLAASTEEATRILRNLRPSVTA